ncbi:g6379 [Coccomyxa viridis]|uniref:G6379 protein n=1 Tax=Coccomyxa viridis TaxID=1274662 RepID=A0ABP1FV90_9CHLO
MMAKTSIVEGDTFRELSKLPGVLEEGTISFSFRPFPSGQEVTEPDDLCHIYILMQPASCRHPVRLLSSDGSRLPSCSTSTNYISGSVMETASTVTDVLKMLGPIQHPDKPHRLLPATNVVGKGVYALYEDGNEVRLLTKLYEQEVSEYPKKTQEELGVYKTGDYRLEVKVRAT